MKESEKQIYSKKDFGFYFIFILCIKPIYGMSSLAAHVWGGKTLWGFKACVCAKKILKLLYSAGTNTDLKESS
jgi:hypothetical protein